MSFSDEGNALIKNLHQFKEYGYGMEDADRICGDKMEEHLTVY